MGPNPEEMKQQKGEALQSLSDFNDGVWSGVATSFSVTSDVAAGITRRKVSKPYKASVSTQFGLGGDGLKIVETLQWESDLKNSEGGTCLSTRSIPIGVSTDVDSVDGSYSCDEMIFKMPSAITGTESLIKFAIEHSLAISDDERMRCFLLYGVESQLVRVMICQERRVKDDGKANNIAGTTLSDEEEIAADINNLVNEIAGKISGSGMAGGLGFGSSEDSEELKGGVTEESTPEDKLDRLKKSLRSSLEQEDAKSFHNKIIPYQVDMFSLTTGVWLGDAVIRDHKEVKSSGKGFETQSRSKAKNFGDGFAEWSLGVQKAAFQFLWDFDESVRHVISWGRSMGARTDDNMPVSSVGVMNDKLMSRRLKPEERMIYIDYDMGKYAGFIVGSVYIKAPRFLTFSETKSDIASPFFTEVVMFQKRTGPDESPGRNIEFDDTEIFCSRMTRLYTKDGELSQGCTSFFVLKPNTSG